jgi:8-oxo-dGTP pyrophosphatase MutT (NUDIX family)
MQTRPPRVSAVESAYLPRWKEFGLMQWKVNQSRIVLRDRWISVRADDCVTPSGIEIAPFYVLEYPDWVHVVAIDTKDQVLFVQQYRHGYGGVTLELPGGMVDASDGSPVAAASRELIEETGYTATSLRLLTSLSPNPATHANRVHVVLAQPAYCAGPASPEPTENISLVRMPLKDAIEMALSGSMVHAQHVGFLMIALRAANLL